MTPTHRAAFLLDVDNPLLDNDRVVAASRAREGAR